MYSDINSDANLTRMQPSDYPPLQQGRGVAVLDEIHAPELTVARVNQVMGEAAARLNGLVKLSYLLLPLPTPRLVYAHVAGSNATPEFAEEVRNLIEIHLINAVEVAAQRGLLPRMALVKIAHYREDLDGITDYCEVPHEDGPMAAPGNTMLWYLLGEPADVDVNGRWLPLSTAHPNIIGQMQVHRAPSPARLRALGRPAARTLIAVFGQNGPLGGLYAWAGMFGIPDLTSALMAQSPALAAEVDNLYGGATKLLLDHPMLRAGVETCLTLANASWNLLPAVWLTRCVLNAHPGRLDSGVAAGRDRQRDAFRRKLDESWHDGMMV